MARVSIIVPCPEPTEFLDECLSSILSQTFRDFEVMLVGVDVGGSDARLRCMAGAGDFVALCKQGLAAAQGEYVWFLDARDRLRVSWVLERCVAALDEQPAASCAMCPAITLRDGAEGGVWHDQVLGTADRLCEAGSLLDHFVHDDPICLSAVMVRRSCCDEAGGLQERPAGVAGWLLLCQLVLQWQVVYLAAPMVNHRLPARAGRPEEQLEGELFVVWTILRAVEERGWRHLVPVCRQAVGFRYGLWEFRLGAAGFENAVEAQARGADEARVVRAHACSTLGNLVYGAGDHARANRLFGQAVRLAPERIDFWLKYVLAQSGTLGRTLLAALVVLRDWLRRLSP